MDIMLDTETLGTDVVTCPILQISLVKFDPTKLYDVAQLQELPSLTMVLEDQANTVIEPDTLRFWLQHDTAQLLRYLINNQKYSQELMLYEIIDFCKSNHNRSFNVWCRGIDFDLTILAQRFKAYKLPMPWRYSAGRDVRTVIDLCNRLHPNYQASDLNVESFTQHDAYYDCLRQIHQLTHIYNKLKSGN